jgi:PAS domain S-box-containing protein
MVFMGAAFTITFVATFFLLDAQMKRVVNRSQSEVYGEKLEGVRRLLETRVRHLAATGMRETYEEDFKASSLKTLRELNYRQGEDGGYLFIVDRGGGVVLHPRLARGDTTLAAGEPVRSIVAAGAATGELDYRGNGAGDHWLIYRAFPDWDWIMAYTIPWEVKYVDVRRLHRELIWIMAFIAAMVLPLLYGIITYFTRPVARLTKAATVMAAGDLDHPIDTGKEGGTGEVEALAASFVRLRDAIRDRINDLGKTNEELRREIEQREKAEESLQESEELHRSTLTSLDDLVFVLDRDSRFVNFWQPGRLGALYIAPEIFIGRSIREIPFPDEARKVWVSAIEVLERAPEVQSFDYHLPMPSGETWYSAKASQRLDSQGRFAGVTVVVRDITDRKRAEEDLERQNVELRKLDRMKDELVRNVSHELKTPVAKQAMQLEILYSLLDTGMPRPQIEAVLGVMEASVSRQQQVIRSLLDLARLESGKRAVAIAPVRLDLVVAEIIEEFKTLSEKAGVAIALEARPITILGDQELLWHVFSNLFSNALKFRRPEGDGRIDVTVGQAGGDAVATVADNGLGMTSEDLEKAFEKFYQASASVEGAGVGLTIAHEMTTLLGGQICLASEGRGLGTRATVTFPVATGSDQVE